MKIRASELQLVTIPDIPIIETGVEWKLGTGDYTPTETDLADAVKAAMEDPTFARPRIKLGHVDGGWQASDGTGSGEPAFGQFDNLRVSEDRQSILADAINVPLWLAQIMPSAYPSRSFEGKQGHTTNAGKSYRLVITAVALLGVELPGIGSLDDFHSLFTDPQITYEEGVYKLAVKAKGKPIKAQIDSDDVKRAFYNDVAIGDKYWWWIRAVRLDPNELIVDDEENGQLYRIPFSVNDRAVTFGDPQAVYIEYKDDPTAEPQQVAASWQSAAESRPSERSTLDPKALRAAIGLPENATEEEVKERLAAFKASAEGTQPPPPAEDTPTDGEEEAEEESSETGEEAPAQEQSTEASGVVTVERQAFEQLRADAAMGRAAREEQLREERESFLAAAVNAGKFPPARKDHFRKLWDADEEGTRKLVASLEDNVVPVQARGASQPTDHEAGADDYPTEHLSPVERERIAAERAARGKGG